MDERGALSPSLVYLGLTDDLADLLERPKIHISPKAGRVDQLAQATHAVWDAEDLSGTRTGRIRSCSQWPSAGMSRPIGRAAKAALCYRQYHVDGGGGAPR